jgi:prepilin-type N-terminal cleavage/methylation domain-containing protein
MLKQGFTLIELMVVIVIIGVLASLAIPKFTEASSKAKMGEAPRIIASFESAYLAGLAEAGKVSSGEDIIFDTIGLSSKWFKYGYAFDVDTLKGLKATAKSKIGTFPISKSLQTAYMPADTFSRSSDGGPINKLIPNFIVADTTQLTPTLTP